MKLIKYLIFLLLIVFIGTAIYFGTQEGDFSVKKSHTIQAPAQLIFEKVNNLKNWPDWQFSEEEVKLFFGDTAAGNGAFISWNGEKYFTGEIKTESIIPLQSIAQKFGLNNTSVEKGHSLSWNFKTNSEDTETEVTWTASGSLSLFEKIYFAWKNRSMEEQLEEVFAKNLQRLELLIESEMNVYSVVVDGLTQHGGGFYLYKTATVKIKELREKVSLLQAEVADYMADNNILPDGNYFVLYHYKDNKNGTAVISVGIPVNDRIIPEEGQPVLAGFLPVTTCLKVTLKGNYLHHSEETWTLAQTRMEDNQWRLSTDKPVIESFIITPHDDKNPADWVTEYFFPLDELSLGVNQPL